MKAGRLLKPTDSRCMGCYHYKPNSVGKFACTWPDRRRRTQGDYPKCYSPHNDGTPYNYRSN